MSHLFCTIANLSALACVAWLGWLVFHGASKWLILVMALCSVHFIIPANDIFICPKCGYIDKVKCFKNYVSTTVQNKTGDE